MKGAAHPRAKLAECDVRAIRAASAAGESRASLARQFIVSETAIYDIATRKSWKSLAK
jgi:hypothetical protein